VYLTRAEPDLTLIDPDNPRPRQLGWVRIDVPREEGHALLLATIAAKSDWYDEVADQMKEDKAAVDLFNTVTPFFRKRLRFPVWLNRPLERGRQPYKGIG
jgi:hypothetical protein